MLESFSMSTETISANLPVTVDDLPAERQRWAAAAIFTALALASLDTAIANIALPANAAVLHANPADVIWVVNVYQIAMVAMLLPLAALGLTGQTIGAALVALCFGLVGRGGATLALVLGAVFAAAGCGMSALRLVASPQSGD
jgi:MFS family permease